MCVSQERQPPNIGLRIKEARESRGITQTRLAELTGSGERTVQAWERNERIPRMDALLVLCRVLDRTPAYFYGTGQEDA